MDRPNGGHDLSPSTHQFIRVLESQMGIIFPYLSIEDSPKIRTNPMLRQVMQLNVAMYVNQCDAHTKDVIMRWLELTPNDLPKGIEITAMLQHDHILYELYSRGLADYINPQLSVRGMRPQLQLMYLEEDVVRLKLAGCEEKTILVTTQPTAEARLMLSFSIDVQSGIPTHNIDLALHVEHEFPFAVGCSVCVQAHHESPRVQPVPLTMFSYNACGAANPAVEDHLIHTVLDHDVHFAIVTETRTFGEQGRELRDSIGFLRGESLDAEGYCGGSWILWDPNIINIEILSKTRYEIFAMIKIIDDPMEGIRMYNPPPPKDRLPLPAKKIIETLESQLSITYPTTTLDDSPEVREIPILRSIVGLIVASAQQIPQLARPIQAILRNWLRLHYTEIPRGQAAAELLEDRDVLKQLYSRGLANKYRPILCLQTTDQDIKIMEARHGIVGFERLKQG
ncbi:hypothetical protein CCACVL1_30914 [Corchorus capsularis]|uniref:Endonuclease/exonuclease/phosphatase n=1 Tax=Corchorus capsularis TaxID=210143 RepID=A0A1R3FUY9_COCAP|nr:hypothetical protein CCACVL1_30914 [Corchorus capsularis]